MIKAADGPVVAIALQVEYTNWLLRNNVFETALLSMLTEASSEAFADFWIIIVPVSTLVAIFAVAI